MSHKIVAKKQLSEDVFTAEIEASLVAQARKPGQFVIISLNNEYGERIPLTIAGADAEKGTITLVIQAVGRSSNQMNDMKEGDYILDLLGPLGIPSDIEKKEGRIVLVGGGLGVAPIFPQLRK